eukprot:gene12682-15913_t
MSADSGWSCFYITTSLLVAEMKLSLFVRCHGAALSSMNQGLAASAPALASIDFGVRQISTPASKSAASEGTSAPKAPKWSTPMLSAAAAAALAVCGGVAVANADEAEASFTLPALPYEMTALEPHLSAKTLEFHWGKHHRAYVDNLNKQVAGSPLSSMSLEEVIKDTWNAGKPKPAFNNAAQVRPGAVRMHSSINRPEGQGQGIARGRGWPGAGEGEGQGQSACILA